MAQPTIQQTFDLALQHQKAGRFGEAQRLYRQILDRQPNHVDAIHLLGVLALQVGQHQAAVELIRQAIALDPDNAEAHYNLGNAFKVSGQFDQAVSECRQAIALRPRYAEAHNNLGVALRALGRLDEAIAAYRQSIASNPNGVQAYNNLGNALRDKGQLDEAIAAYLQAKALDPRYPDAHSNLGMALREKGEFDEAIASLRRAVALDPKFAQARFALGLELLTRGEFQQGWEEYEWRKKAKDSPAARRDFTVPRWDGSPLQGRTLLIHAEQGLGDTLHFIRYLPMVARQGGGNVIVEYQAELDRLLQPIAEGCQVVVRGEALPAFDVQCALLSLPRIFRTDLTNMPNAVPYLRAHAEEAENGRARLAGAGQSVKVGLVWAGSATHKRDRNRSIKLASLSPLWQIPGVRFFSLQKGEAAAQAKTLPAGMELIDWTEQLQDFADTAALIANLDLVITVDTAVAHLAGAMAKPVWTLLPFVPDWRWMLQREDSPWYPTMRLFRQAGIGEWENVIMRVAEALSQWGRFQIARQTL